MNKNWKKGIFFLLLFLAVMPMIHMYREQRMQKEIAEKILRFSSSHSFPPYGRMLVRATKKVSGEARPPMTRLCRARGFFMAGGTHSLPPASKGHDKGGMTMKKFIITLLSLLFFCVPAMAEYKPIPETLSKQYKAEM